MYWEGGDKAATTSIPYFLLPRGYVGSVPKAATLPDGYRQYYGDMSEDNLDVSVMSNYSAATGQCMRTITFYSINWVYFRFATTAVDGHHASRQCIRAGFLSRIGGAQLATGYVKTAKGTLYNYMHISSYR